MKSTTTRFTVLSLLFILNINIYSQDPHLDVEGDVKIRGNIDIHHPDDTTSVYIGRLAGNSTSHTSNRFNSFFGSRSGFSNTTGDRNSFFGTFSGLSNTMGFRNSFFGNESGLSNTTGGLNSFFGNESGFSNTTGFNNSFFGKESGYSNTTASQNSFFGSGSGRANTTGFNNSFFGCSSGWANTTGVYNSFFGNESGRANTTGGRNSFFGYRSGESNISGDRNSFFGTFSGLSNTTGFRNSFFGNESGESNTTGFRNSFFGNESGESNTTGSWNSFFGSRSGFSNTTGGFNSFFGYYSGSANTTGDRNSFFGYKSGFSHNEGDYNTAIGYDAGVNIGKGSQNTFIGALATAESSVDSLVNSAAIGYGAKVGCDYCAVIGGTGSEALNVGIGTTLPTKSLDVRGQVILHNPGNNPGLYISPSSGGPAVDPELVIQSSETAAGNNAPFHISRNAHFNTDSDQYHYISNSTNHSATKIEFEADGDLVFSTAVQDTGVVTFSDEMIIKNDGKVGIGTTTPQSLLEVDGNIRSQGTTCRSGSAGAYGSNIHNIFWSGSDAQLWIDATNVGNIQLISDRRLKKNIHSIQDHAIARIMALKPLRYQYKNIDNTIFQSDGRQYEGFVADELQEIIPSAVNGSKNDLTSEGGIQPQTINSLPLIAVLTKAMQEQQSEIEALKKELLNVQEMEKKIEKLEQMILSLTSNADIED